ncbi:hypothetical protein B6A27_14560 [Anoxybacillus sp. UARK-01]|nr:hypothetical protein B6A27_14560 [Anoxybacillus sp. UARK-01]
MNLQTNTGTKWLVCKPSIFTFLAGPSPAKSMQTEGGKLPGMKNGKGVRQDSIVAGKGRLIKPPPSSLKTASASTEKPRAFFRAKTAVYFVKYGGGRS